MANDTTARGAGKHEKARQLAEQAVKAEARGESDRAAALFAEATRTDATAAADVLQQEKSVGGPAPGLPQKPGDATPEQATEVRPASDPPSRAGITETGSGADAERR